MSVDVLEAVNTALEALDDARLLRPSRMPLLPNRDRKTDSGDAFRPPLSLTKAEPLIQKIWQP
jgi:hypothetical protein